LAFVFVLTEWPTDYTKLSPARAQWVLARPRTLLDRAWAQISLPKKISWLEPRPKHCFLLFYNVKCAGGPPIPRPGPRN
jgi:hypothetical protein